MKSPQIILTIGSFLVLTLCLQYLNKPYIGDGLEGLKLAKLQEKKDCKNGFCPLP